MKHKLYLFSSTILSFVSVTSTFCYGDTLDFQAISNAKSNPEVSINYDENYVKADKSSVKCKLKKTDLSLRNEGIETRLPQKENYWTDTNIIEFWLHFEFDTRDGGIIFLQPTWDRGHSEILYKVNEGWNKITWERKNHRKKLLTLRIKTFFEYYDKGEEITFYVSHFGLAQDLVDSVIGVGMSTNNPLVPQYQIIHDSEDVDKLNGSKYAYMPFELLYQLLDTYKDNKKE